MSELANLTNIYILSYDNPCFLGEQKSAGIVEKLLDTYSTSSYHDHHPNSSNNLLKGQLRGGARGNPNNPNNPSNPSNPSSYNNHLCVCVCVCVLVYVCTQVTARQRKRGCRLTDKLDSRKRK